MNWSTIAVLWISAAAVGCSNMQPALTCTVEAQARPTHAGKPQPALALAAVANPRADAQLLHAPAEPPFGRADGIVDLGAPEGLALVNASWRYHDAQLMPVDARGPGPDLHASGPRIKGFDLDVHAGSTSFDDSRWEVLGENGLLTRRGPGHVSFGWYRLGLTLPARIGNVEVEGATIAFEIVVDDYAELWVDGKLSRALGQRGGSLIAGFNAPNRVVLTRAAHAGQKIQVAVLAVNGPISAQPENFLWVRSATLDVYRARPAAVSDTHGQIVRLDPSLDAIVPKDARIEKLATGFDFIEGPVWSDGGLLFSDPNQNLIYRYEPEGRLSVVRVKSGYAGVDLERYHQPGSNGLAVDSRGRLTIDQHGQRRVVRIEPTGAVTVLADRYQGKRLNSPNDLVYRSDDSLYFTDPPFGLPGVYDDSSKELDFSGVFRASHGSVQLLTKELKGPNGIAFSPDEHFLYVGNWDVQRKVVMRYPLQPDGTLGKGTTFYDVTATSGEQAIDGIKVDLQGNLYVSGPGGVHVVSAAGKALGRLVVDEQPANFAWGDADGRGLYLAAHSSLYRIRLNVAGAGRRSAQ